MADGSSAAPAYPATFMRYQSPEVQKPSLPLRSVDRSANLEIRSHPPSGWSEDKGPIELTQEAAETLLRSLAEEPFETVFEGEDPLSSCSYVRNLDTKEVRPLAPESFTESFVGKLFKPKPTRHHMRPWKLWWCEKRRKDELLLEAALLGDAAALLDLLEQPPNGNPPAAANAFACGARCAWQGRAALHLAVQSESLEAVEVLLDKGAQVNVRSRPCKLTPLHVASAQGSIDLVSHLLTARADVLCQTEDRQIALHYAAANGHSEVVKVLLKQDASQLGYRNILGQRPAEAAADFATLCAFRAWEFQCSSFTPSGGTGSCGTGSWTGGRRNSGCSEASTATGSELPVLESEKPHDHSDLYAERSTFGCGTTLLLRNARPDAVQRLLEKTRQLEAANEKPEKATLTARALKDLKASASPKDSPSRSPVSSGTSTPASRARGPPFARMKRGHSRVEKVGPNSFELVNLLGRGSFGEVFQVKHKRTGKAYAMKVLQKSRIMGSNLLRYAVTERNILAYIQHPYIVSLHYAFQTTSHLVLVLQYCPGGNLQHLLTREKRLCETLTRFYAAEILLALIHLHERNTVFRDLKPDNVVLDETHHALLTDFGLSKEGVTQRGTCSFCGSVAFLAPEILLRKGHNLTVDIYNLGVLVYDMLTGMPPFYHHDRETLFTHIKHAHLEVPLYVSRVARAFIEATMERDPSKRLGAHGTETVKDHVFFMETDFDMLMRREVPVPEAHPADEPSIPCRSPLGLARLESPFARAERAPGWRSRYARTARRFDRGVPEWDISIEASASTSLSADTGNSSGAYGSESSGSTWRRGLPFQRRPSSQSSREL
ncbi:unnamed protein product [Durusdinium trenchii]|uniref:Protein kinase domain-containing protein n=1 Tax=Durusdinium trenchii TaxID=1381693 RepID=A0ABP0P1Q1_9DINO